MIAPASSAEPVRRSQQGSAVEPSYWTSSGQEPSMADRGLRSARIRLIVIGQKISETGVACTVLGRHSFASLRSLSICHAERSLRQRSGPHFSRLQCTNCDSIAEPSSIGGGASGGVSPAWTQMMVIPKPYRCTPKRGRVRIDLMLTLLHIRQICAVRFSTAM